MFAHAARVVYTNEMGYIYVKRKQSILTSTYNEKRLDSFLAWNEIIDYINKNYKKITKTVNASFAYWCLDHVSYILSQVSDDKEKQRLLKNEQVYIRQHYSEFLENKLLTKRQKMIITFYSLPSLFCLY